MTGFDIAREATLLDVDQKQRVSKLVAGARSVEPIVLSLEGVKALRMLLVRDIYPPTTVL